MGDKDRLYSTMSPADASLTGALINGCLLNHLRPPPEGLIMSSPYISPLSKMKFLNFRFGFTLIELLTIIAILALLIGLIYSVYFQAREKARQITCISNLGQLGKAIIMYAYDHDDFLPPYRTFVQTEVSGLVSEVCAGVGATPDVPQFYAPWLFKSVLYSYLRDYDNIWFCPSDPYARTETYYWCIPHHYLSYAISTSWRKTVNGYIYSDGRILPPSETVLGHDANMGYTDIDREFSPPAHRALFDVRGCEHFEGVNVLYLDNHVKWERHKGWK